MFPRDESVQKSIISIQEQNLLACQVFLKSIFKNRVILRTEKETNVLTDRPKS